MEQNGAGMDVREARCHLLAEVLAADGIMTEEERALLESCLVKYQLSDEQRERVRNFEGRNPAIAVVYARPVVERQEIVDELVEAALADGKLTALETAAVKRIVDALDLG